jgi:uncharacterized Ntn-hydrolase superfamily protein
VTQPVNTFSIVARDDDTGMIGGAVQSHWFSVGNLVLWGEAGLGVVATQALIDPSYGPLGLELLRCGRSPDDALRGLVAADSAPEVRQVGIADARGNVASHTGSRCIPMAGHVLGDGYAAQANMMERDTVWGAMAEAFEASTGDLAKRLLAALDAAQGEGGDIRGMQSAAILILRAEPTGRAWEDRVMDLRVEDHPQPLVELKRLVNLHRAYEHMNAGDHAMERDDMVEARRQYSAAEALVPDNVETIFWHAVTLANGGAIEDALPLFERTFSADGRWATLAGRLAKVALLTVGDQDLERIMDLSSSTT